MARNSQHVVKHGDGWAVRASGASRVTVQTETQREAIRIGQQIAENQRGELFIHGRDGQIRERNTYGNDPCPPRG